METLQISKENAQKAFNSAKNEGKALLANLFGKEVFNPGKITDWVKTFEDACAVTGNDPIDEKFTEGDTDDNAYQKLKVIARALNEGWKPDWNNGNQRKWSPWFYLGKPGFRFIDAYYAFTNSHSTGGSRLCCASEELAVYAGKQFLDIYEDFLG